MSHEATSDRALATPRQASPSLAMAPHLSFAELDLIAKAAGEQKAPKDIHALISAKRRARKVDPPKIWAVRRAVKGTTHFRVSRSRGLVLCNYVPYKLYKPGYKPAYKLL